MPSDLTALAATGISVKKSRHILSNAGEASFDLLAQPGSDVLAALVTNASFPLRKIALEEIGVKVSGDHTVPLGGPKGAVSFSGTASGYEGVSVVDSPADVVALLVRDQLQDDIAKGLALSNSPTDRFLVLRWGYDLQAAAKGSVALGAGPKATFGAEGKRLGAFAIVHTIHPGHRSVDVLRRLFDAWMLPSQFSTLDDLAPGSAVVAEVDGSIALKLGAQYGYDFSWVREDVALASLSGDIGLKIQLGASASVGFEASGQYAIALTRPLEGRRLRLQLFRLNRKGLSLAFSASASAQGSFGGLLPAHFDDFVGGVFGLHALQVLKEIDRLTDPSVPLSDVLAGVTDKYAKEFLTKVTGIDAETAFNDARDRLVGLLSAWHDLPHKVASTVLSTVQHAPASVGELKKTLQILATQDLTSFQPDLEQLLGRVDFFKTPFGQWLEAAVLTSVLSAGSERAEFARVQQVAKQTLSVLDGSLIESTLVRLQKEVDQRLGLDAVSHIIDQATFDRADEWLKKKLSAFLGTVVDLPRVEQIRTAVSRLRALQERFFQQAKTALARKYEVELLATYQRTATETALLDVLFDYEAPHAAADALNRLVMAAIDGQYDRVLDEDMAGVSLREAALTHGIRRQTHLELTMPFFHVEMDHVNTSLAKKEAIDTDRGRLIVYDLHADDLKTAKGKFSSRLTVNARFAQGTTRVFDDQSMTFSYAFRQGVPNMRRRALEAQLKTYSSTYFPGVFGSGEASLTTWISDLDRTVDKVLNNGPDNFGTTLISLEASAPAGAVNAWALAPPSPKADQYFEMSRRIQVRLRSLIPLAFFQDPRNYRTLAPAAALLVYASLPPTSGVSIAGGRVELLNTTSDIYPDIDTSGHLEALIQDPHTTRALTARLVAVHELLLHAEGMEGLADDYDASKGDAVIGRALSPVGLADLKNLLIVEREVIRDAAAAGVAIAGFVKAKDGVKARQRLAEYGAKVTTAFNSKIGGLFSGTELRSLGPMVFLEAGRALDPRLGDAPPSALLELTVLKDAPSVPLRDIVDGADAPAGDVVHTERLVSLARA
jgi:hypothetical protein